MIILKPKAIMMQKGKIDTQSFSKIVAIHPSQMLLCLFTNACNKTNKNKMIIKTNKTKRRTKQTINKCFLFKPLIL